ncbi:T6SS effector BTH_I2691 family protein [Comamonas sp. NoAH]|uniref:T6SS effector BTH_I2691 family protein n=1 Tax=Comamonas halotolerans TaxID=3041496 RepID=UPI0024E135DB|nr:T6SS effector BTH_I2691 family protein [Comamonas sp. NoAH]
MGTNKNAEQEHCPDCTRFGLPIMPVRYALAWNSPELKTKAPGLIAPFGQGVNDIALPKTAIYTLRRLRPGYLYVFNEVRGQWKAYLVSENYELQEFDYRQKAPPHTNELSLVCSRHGTPPLAGCVMIPDAGNAGKVWFAFSDTPWTQKVFEKHRSQECRKRHMQVIDVKAWVDSGGAATQAHTASMERIGDIVCEYNVPIPERNSHDEVVIVAYKSFSHASDPLATLTEEKEKLITAAQEAGKQWGYPPAIIAVNDPVGITADLASLIRTELQEEVVVRRASEKRPLAVASVIKEIKKTITADAENRQIFRTEIRAHQLLNGGYDPGAQAGMAIADWLFPENRKARQEIYEEWSTPTPEEMQEARKDAWEKYQKKYDEKKLLAWESQWNQRLASYDTSVLLPLANAHVKWIESEQLFNHLDCSHEDSDPASIEGYINKIILVIQDTQQYAPCFALYERWLAASSIEKNNLILRALALNTESIVQEINKFTGDGLSPDTLKSLPWDPLIQAYEESEKALGTGASNTVIRMTSAMGGILAKIANKAVDGVIGPGLVMMGVIAKSPVVMVEAVMSKGDAIKELVSRMSAVNPKVSDLRSLNRAIEIEMRKARIYGVSVQGTGKFRYLIMADARVVQDFPGVDAQGNARRFAENAILTEADRKRLTQMRWKKLLPSSAGLGVVTGILQLVALSKLASDLDRSMAHEKNENQGRYLAGCAALAGTLADTIDKWSTSAAEAGSRAGRFIQKYCSRVLQYAAKALGFVAGAAMTIWDSYRGYQEFKEGNYAVAWLYAGSATVSLVAVLSFTKLGALIFGAAATGVGIILVVLAVLIAVLIEIFKDNKIQDWLERCYFGLFDKYSDLNIEMQELDIALKG